MGNLKRLGTEAFVVNPLVRFQLGSVIFVAILLSSLLPVSFIALNPVIFTNQPIEDPREGWAVLMEMNFYDSGSHLPTGYSDTCKWNDTLHALGWQTNHILIHRGPITQQIGEAALQFLATNADANDVVLFFVFAHGNYLLADVQWQAWFPTQWSNLLNQEKIFMVAACTSEYMLQPLYSDPAPHIHLASTEADEYAWAGLPEEGLPVIGEVFNHFFTDALVNASADTNADGDITVEEAFNFASPLSRSYISSVVFPAFPDFEVMCNGSAPHPVMDDSYPSEFSLQVEEGDAPIPPKGIPLFLPEILFIVTLICITGVVILLFFRRR